MTDTRPLSADDVAQFLAQNPDFFQSHPDALLHLSLPHGSGEAVSLIERQVGLLRERNEKLTGQLQQLVKVATDNEALMHRLHELTLELMSIGDLDGFFRRLCEVLQQEFEADALSISLFDCKSPTADDLPVSYRERDDQELQPLRAQLDKGESSCGRLNRTKLELLFPEHVQWVQSTALIPIGQQGLMAIGSSDPARFYPGMGTLFLDLLARVIEHRLQLEEPAQQRRTA